MTTEPDDDNLIDIKKVMEIIGLGKTMVYRLERQGKFPQRYKPGGWSSRWSEREVRVWKDAQRAV